MKGVAEPEFDGVFNPLDNTFTDAFGTTINVHPRENCIGRGSCAIHDPSDHPMRGFPISIRVPDPIMDIKPLHLERICPHGVGHPDPDDMVFWLSIHQDDMGVHGCDGCCDLPAEGEDDEQDSS